MNISKVWLQSSETTALCQRAEILTVSLSPHAASSLLLLLRHSSNHSGFGKNINGARNSQLEFIEQLFLTCHPTPWHRLYALAKIIIVTVE